MLLFGHLSIATRLQRLRRIGLAIAVVVPLAGLAELNDAIHVSQFDTAIHFPAQLKPVPPSWIPSSSMEDFFAATNALEEAVNALSEEGEDG